MTARRGDAISMRTTKTPEKDGSAVSLKTVAALSFAANSNGSPTSRKCSQARFIIRSPIGELAEHNRVSETSPASVAEMLRTTAETLARSPFSEEDRLNSQPPSLSNYASSALNARAIEQMAMAKMGHTRSLSQDWSMSVLVPGSDRSNRGAARKATATVGCERTSSKQ